jgi:hypothetical protein
MGEDETVIGAAKSTEGMTEGLYDRAIAALGALDARALIALQAECEEVGRAILSPVLTSQAQSMIAAKHRILAKLLAETRHNLRVLYPREVFDGVHAESSWIDGRKGATWLR